MFKPIRILHDGLGPSTQGVLRRARQGPCPSSRRHTGAGGRVAAGDGRSWPRPGLSFPREAVGGCWAPGRVVLALPGHLRLHGRVSVSGSWRRCAGGSLEFTAPRGSGPLLPSRGPGWPSSSSVTMSGCDPALWQCLSGGCGGLRHILEEARVFAVQQVGGEQAAAATSHKGVVGGAPACGIGTVVSRSSGAHCWYRAGSCRSGCSGGPSRHRRWREGPCLWRQNRLRESHCASQAERG